MQAQGFTGWTFSLTVLLLLAHGLGHAQVTTATIYGSVADPSGAAIPGANVNLTNEDTGTSVSTVSNAVGEFTAASLFRGRYTVEIEAQGFKSSKQTGVLLSAGQQLRVLVQLEVGAVSETVEVTGELPLVQTSTAEQRHNLTGVQIDELPKPRRDWTNLINIGTGISTAGSNGVSLNGLPPASFKLTVDGTNSEGDPELPSLSMFQAPNYIKSISTEAILEVNVAKGIASAEIGSTMSGNVNITTKGGTNEFHGSLFELNQTENLSARPQFQVRRAPVVYNQFGGSLGGPVVRNRLFFFGVYEGYRERAFRTVTGNVPTAEFRQQAIAAQPVYRQMLEFYPLPTDPTAPGAVAGFFNGTGSAAAQDNHAVGRVDWNVTSNTLANFRYTRGRPFRLEPRFAEINSRTFDALTESGSMTVTHFRAGWSSESRVGYNLNDVQRLDGVYDTGVACFTGLPFGAICGETLFKGGSTKSFEQNFSTSRGIHSIKFGGSMLQRVTGRENIEAPEVGYPNTADFLQNLPNAVQVTFGIDEFQIRSVDTGFFFQDDIKVSPNLVVNVGVRYDYFFVPIERDGRFFNRDGAFGLGNFVDPQSIYNADRNNFSPRLGFAYSMGRNQKTVVRGGFGAFHNPHTLFGGPVELVRNSLTQPNRVNLTRADVLSGEFGNSLRFPVVNSAVLPFVDRPGGVVSGTTINTNFPNPYSMQWNLGVQRQLAKDWVFETSYVGTRGLKLNVVRDVNQPDRETGIRPNSGFGQFRYYDTSDSTSYNAWQSSLRKRFGGGFQFGLNHTWSRVMSYSDGDLLLSAVPQDFNNIRADRAPAPFDIAHRVISDFSYELPFVRAFGASSGAARRVLGGWSVSGIFTAQTGSPFTVFQNNAGLGSARVDLATAQNPVLENYRDTLVYLGRESFSQIPIGATSRVAVRPGNLGRNAIRGPGLNVIDLSLAKNTAITEGTNLQFRVDMLNGFNRTNYTNPVTAITNSNFGRITGTRGARVVQLYLRLTF